MKKRVPLTMDDLNPGWIIRNRACKFVIAEVSGAPDDPPDRTGVLPAGTYSYELIGFDEMAEHGHEYSPDGGKTWHPCWKEVEE